MSDIIAAFTTVRQGNRLDPVECMRAEIALDTYRLLKEGGIPAVAIHTDTSAEYLNMLETREVELLPQRGTGMGSARREALESCLRFFPKANYFFWLEPEKPDMVRFAMPMAEQMLADLTSLGRYNRVSMDTYPVEQACYYRFCRAVASRLVGWDFDYGFGPMMLTRKSAPFFLSYLGTYGDQWDSILIPRLRVIHSGLRITAQPVDFRNDWRMTEVEDGRQEIILKRVEQLGLVVPSMIREWNTLLRNPGP